MPYRIRTLFSALAVLFVFCAAGRASDNTVKLWDFTKKDQAWKGNGWLRRTGRTAEGARYKSIGVTPLMQSPVFDLPAGREYRLSVRMKKDAGASATLYYGESTSDQRKIRFDTVPDNEWRMYGVFLPPLGAGARLWLDPGAPDVTIEVSEIRIEDVSPLTPPGAAASRDTAACPGGVTLTSGDAIAIENAGCTLFSDIVKVRGARMAPLMEDGVMGIMTSGGVEWRGLETIPVNVTGPVCSEGVCAVTVVGALKDADGAEWKISKTLRSRGLDGRIDVDISIQADREAALVHFPWLTLFAGRGSFGARKNQALFSGLDYLAGEPSSSEADIIGPESVRIAPDRVRITIPLMAVQGGGGYIAVIWEPSDFVQPVFDSPDRVFNSGATLMGLWAQAVGENRRENALYPFRPLRVEAGKPLVVSYTIAGGAGDSVVPAIQQYVAMRDTPPVPEIPGGMEASAEKLACGWLDSELRSGDLWRHAVWGSSFGPAPAADAPMFMLQLAGMTMDNALSERLGAAAAGALARLARDDPYFRGGVGHVRFPAPALLFGNVGGYADAFTADARAVADNNFDAQGIRHYFPDPARLDYSSTHYENHANGQAATDLYQILTAAALSGDPDLIKKGLWLLDRQTGLYANTVPRGAQTWEIPLHTPDIMASAYMLKCYVLAYKLTGNADYLAQARYWAWTGLPFVYLIAPEPGEVGVYSTIAVYGATSWKSPNWIGLPVQWCGLVYASALFALAEVDDSGPWLKVAKGIVAAGLLMSYPGTDAARCGLLPDSYSLKAQRRNGPDINPGTLQAHLSEFFGTCKLYDFKRLEQSGMLAHAPCEITKAVETMQGFSIFLGGAVGGSYNVLIANAASPPLEITFHDRPDAPGLKLGFDYDAANKRIVIRGINGAGEIRVFYGDG